MKRIVLVFCGGGVGVGATAAAVAWAACLEHLHLDSRLELRGRRPDASRLSSGAALTRTSPTVLPSSVARVANERARLTALFPRLFLLHYSRDDFFATIYAPAKSPFFKKNILINFFVVFYVL